MRAVVLLLSVLLLASGCGAPATGPAVSEGYQPAVEPEQSGESAEAEIVAAAVPTVTEEADLQPVARMAAPVALPKLYDFWATWCPPCRQQKPIIDELRAEYDGQVDVVAIDVDQEGELAQRYEVKVIPTLVLLDAGGKEVERLTGLTQKDKLVERFRAHGFIE